MQSALGVEPGALCFGGEYPARKQGMQSIALGRSNVKQFLSSWCYTRPYELFRGGGVAETAGGVGEGRWV